MSKKIHLHPTHHKQAPVVDNRSVFFCPMQHIRRSLLTCYTRQPLATSIPFNISLPRYQATSIGSLRWKISSLVEPPLDGDVLEKPCTLVLLEDSCLYHTRWHDTFQANIPARYGMSYISLTLTESNGLDNMIDEMKQDLPSVHDAILVTRGPMSSWVALFYLESFPLKGLVMIDPVVFDTIPKDDTTRWNDVSLQDKSKESNHSTFYDAFIQQACSKKLKLEPNSVPMFVIQSIDNPRNTEHARQMAERQSDFDGPFGQVLLTQLFDEDPTSVMNEIDDWVESIL